MLWEEMTLFNFLILTQCRKGNLSVFSKEVESIVEFEMSHSFLNHKHYIVHSLLRLYRSLFYEASISDLNSSDAIIMKH